MIQQLLESLNELSALADKRNLIINARAIFMISVSSVLIIDLILFVLLGIGLYTIGKRGGVKGSVMAFIPFVNMYYLGKIVGPVILFRQRFKNLGLWVMITSLITTTLVYTHNIITYWDCLVNLITINQFELTKNAIILGSWHNNAIYLNDILSVIASLTSLANLFFYVFLLFPFFQLYAKSNHNFYAILAIFFDILFPIFVFAFRKNERFDYSQYLKMKFGTYNGRGSAGGFNNPQSPFTQDPQKDRESPFDDGSGDDTQDQGDDVFCDY